MTYDDEPLREQMRSDYKDLMLGLASQRDAISAAMSEIMKLLDQVTRLVADGYNAQSRIIGEYFEKTDTNLGKLAEAVEGPESRLGKLETRVDAIEKKLFA